MVAIAGFAGRGQKREKNTAQKKYANRKLRGKIKNLLTEFKESAKIREVKGVRKGKEDGKKISV
jgi:hypothetical protein